MLLRWAKANKIFHSVRCQFTSGDFVARLKTEEIKISLVMVEGVLRQQSWWEETMEESQNMSEVYLRAYSRCWEAESALSPRFLMEVLAM